MSTAGPAHLYTAIARCFTYPQPPGEQVLRLVNDVLREPSRQRETLERLGERIATTLGGRDQVALVYGGATGIKDYVFEAPRLPQIRGASALLDWINEQALRDIWRANDLEDSVVYASGGTVLGFMPIEKGQAAADAIERCYVTHTLTADSVAVTSSFSLLELRYGRLPQTGELFWAEEFERAWGDEELRHELAAYYDGTPEEAPRERFLRRKTFGECVTLLTTAVNRRREERATNGEVRTVASYPQLPWASKCDSSDIRPAVVTLQVAGQRRAMSEASARKHYIGQVVKRDRASIRHWPFDWPDESIQQRIEQHSWERQWDQYLEREGKASAYAAHPDARSARPARDVGEIGPRSIGLIYADANTIGRTMASLQTPLEYQHTSQELHAAAQQAVFEALARHLAPQPVRSVKNNIAQTEYVHPFEILSIGGDDLLLIVPGERALDMTLQIGQVFEQQLTMRLSQEDGNPQPQADRYIGPSARAANTITPQYGLSAGVVIAQQHSPIFLLEQLVTELLKNAKKLARERRHEYGDAGGAVDFMVMKSITMASDTITTLRAAGLGDNRYPKAGDAPVRRLTARPYTWNEFAGLLATARALEQNHVPRSQLYRLRQVMQDAIESGITTSVMEYLYTRTRMRNEHSEALLRHIEQHWQGQSGQPGHRALGPWLPMKREQDWETIWGDLLEVYDVLPKETP